MQLFFAAVALHFGGALHAAADGEKHWAAVVTNRGGISYSSPALSPDGLSIYVGVVGASGGSVVAFSPEGSERWHLDLPGLVEASPAVAPDGTLYIGAANSKLYSLTPASSGRSVTVNWSRSIGGYVTSSAAIAADGTVYVGASDGQLHAFAPDGTEKWTFPTGGIIESSPAIAADGTIYFGSYDKSVYAVTPAGAKKWSSLPPATAGLVFSSPAIGADGTVYIGSSDMNMYALRPDDGGVKWQYATNGPIDASPVIGADGTIYFAADRNFYALKPEPGLTVSARLRWKSDLHATSASTAAVRGDGLIIFGADDGTIRALNPDDGTEKWRFDTQSGEGTEVLSSPLIAPDGSIYIGSLDGNLYNLYGNGSPLSTYSSWPAFRRDLARTGRAAPSTGGGQLINIATRAQIGGDRALIAGFVVQYAQQSYLIRAAGPALAPQGVVGFLPDPNLQLFSGKLPLQFNDDWPDHDAESGAGIVDTAVAVGAFPFQTGSKDAAILRPLPPGAYTALIRSADTSNGVALAEVYDARGFDTAATSRIVNLSTRGPVGTGENILIAGVVITGSTPARLLLRGVGPGLAQFGVPGFLAQPKMELFKGAKSLGSNVGWTSTGLRRDIVTAAAAVSAFALPNDSADCAMIVTLDPGLYTIQISGVNSTTGEALVEVYVLP